MTKARLFLRPSHRDASQSTRLRISLLSSIILRASLVAVTLAACGPAEGPAPADTLAATQPATVLSPTETAPAATLEPSPVPEATALPVATSRGPELHATDPTTVNLASGGLQFVEFFRFT